MYKYPPEVDDVVVFITAEGLIISGTVTWVPQIKDPTICEVIRSDNHERAFVAVNRIVTNQSPLFKNYIKDELE